MSTSARSKASLLAGGAFLAALWLPLAASFTGVSRRNLLETERGEEKPVDLGAKTDHWLRERTGFRRAAIAARRDLLVHGLGESTVDDVSIGRDGWLFYAPRRSTEAIARRKKFGTAQIRFWQRTFEAREKWLRQQGIAYVVMVVPDKESIYPERAPELVRWPDGATPLDRLARALDGRIIFADARDALREERAAGHDVYHRSDSHWNRLGAWIGYRVLADRIAAADLPIRPVEIDRSKLALRDRAGGDLAAMLGIHFSRVDRSWWVPSPPRVRSLVVLPTRDDERFRDWQGAPHLVTENPAGELGRAVFFRDSCAGELLHWLPVHFRRARISWLNPRTAAFAWSIIREERPELVIDEFVERKLLQTPYRGPDDPASPEFDPAHVPPGDPDGPA